MEGKRPSEEGQVASGCGSRLVGSAQARRRKARNSGPTEGT